MYTSLVAASPSTYLGNSTFDLKHCGDRECRTS